MPKPNLKLMLITNHPEVAEFVTQRGVDRVFVDLEILGKQERQGHLDTVISRHSMNDVSVLRPLVPRGALLVRLNPVHDGTQAEVDEALTLGADELMLPMFSGPSEVEYFCRAVGQRARVCLLVETIGAMESLAECARVPGVDQVHIGLNDLHIQLGNRFMFEPLANGLVDRMAHVLNDADVPFGFGGIARVGEGLLPAELLLSEHARLGSQAVILSRTFHRQARSVAELSNQMDFAAEVGKLRDAHRHHCESDPAALDALHGEVAGLIRSIAARMPSSR
jgi:2-keto-3-deoxy-L-rhamnonate aldolase RhmA